MSLEGWRWQEEMILNELDQLKLQGCAVDCIATSRLQGPGFDPSSLGDSLHESILFQGFK